MNTFKKFFTTTSVCFTLVTYLATLFMFTTGNSSYAFTFATMSRVLIFSAVTGLAGLILLIKKVPSAILRTVHFLLMCINFSLVIATLPYGSDFRMIFASLLCFAVVYWIIIGLVALIKTAASKMKKQD